MNEIISAELAELREAEAMAIEGAAQWIAGQTTVAIALHKIVTQKLYLQELDDHGLPQYKSFEDYWQLSLEGKMGVSRSQAFNCLRDIRIALGPSFKLDYEAFARLGGTARFSAVPEVAEYNQKTGEVLGLRDGYEVPEDGDVSEFILNHMNRYLPSGEETLNLNVSQYKDQLRKDLKTGRTVELVWSLMEIPSPEGIRLKTKWEKIVKDGIYLVEHVEGFIDDPNILPEIRTAYEKRLPITGLFKFKEAE